MNKISNISKIKSETWAKNWSGNWQMPFASLYHVYTMGLKSYIGVNLKKNLLMCEEGLSSNYIAKKDLDLYCNYLAKEVIRNNFLVNKWSEDTISTAEQIFKILNKLKDEKNLTAANLEELKSEFYKHVPPHFSIKKVIDYLPKKLQLKFMPKLLQARLKTENLFNAVDFALRSYCKKISKETERSEMLTKYLTIEEIISYLKDKKLPGKKELIDRAKGTAMFCENESFNLIINDEFNTLQKFLIGQSGDTLKGSPAFKGIAKGIARIVLDPYNVRIFNKGDILITGMTRPEFLPLMKIASAFITDAGGLLSHAAIVARELKKPCILATESASKVIKNGDFIEVDANKGIIKILKRA